MSEYQECEALGALAGIVEGQSAEEQIEARVDWLVRQLDELCAMARDEETQDLIAGQAIGIGQLAFRAQLILSFLEARKSPQLKVISNGY